MNHDFEQEAQALSQALSFLSSFIKVNGPGILAEKDRRIKILRKKKRKKGNCYHSRVGLVIDDHDFGLIGISSPIHHLEDGHVVDHAACV